MLSMLWWQEAEAYIGGMKAAGARPNEVTWTALLGAARTHGDVDLAKRVSTAMQAPPSSASAVDPPQLGQETQGNSGGPRVLDYTKRLQEFADGWIAAEEGRQERG